MQTFSERFAQVSVELFGDDGPFAMELAAGEDIQEIVLAFENLGCSVESQGTRIKIKAPSPPR